jgi:hypothetical protein
MNTQTTTQINQFLPVFSCSISLIFFKLFCNSSLPLSVQQVCSASTFSVILLCFNFLCYSSLHLISLCTCVQIHSAHPLLFPFLQFHSFSSRTANPTQSVSSSFIHMSTTFQLPNSLGKMTTTVQATETPTDRQLICNHESVLLTDSKLRS